jgi:hypothetical protein
LLMNLTMKLEYESFSQMNVLKKMFCFSWNYLYLSKFSILFELPKLNIFIWFYPFNLVLHNFWVFLNMWRNCWNRKRCRILILAHFWRKNWRSPKLRTIVFYCRIIWGIVNSFFFYFWTDELEVFTSGKSTFLWIHFIAWNGENWRK